MSERQMQWGVKAVGTPSAGRTRDPKDAVLDLDDRLDDARRLYSRMQDVVVWRRCLVSCLALGRTGGVPVGM